MPIKYFDRSQMNAEGEPIRPVKAVPPAPAPDPKDLRRQQLEEIASAETVKIRTLYADFSPQEPASPAKSAADPYSETQAVILQRIAFRKQKRDAALKTSSDNRIAESYQREIDRDEARLDALRKSRRRLDR